jgi:glycosyltransferase involved in cell wall biosynthesis
MARQANGFFAYTAGVKQYLIRHGLSAQKIFVVNNTIDINQQREVFNKLRSKREEIKRELGLIDKKVLLFVGRMTANKRIDFLLRSFSILHRADSSFHLLLVGSGGETLSRNGLNSVSFLGPIVGLDKLGPIYVASDMYVFPGSVGLGPLQALCYDLPAITIDSDTHMPEIEYLLSTNSIVLKSSVTPEEYAKAILNLYKDPAHLRELKANIWPSIRHLTIEQMAQNFIRGVNTLLELP